MSKLPDENCNNCPNSHRCSEVYEKIGNSNCKPVAKSVVIAFLLPIVVFIVSVAVCKELLAAIFSSEIISSSVSLLLGLIITAGCVYVMRLFLVGSGRD
jgi:uncharacterized protein YqhQ